MKKVKIKDEEIALYLNTGYKFISIVAINNKNEEVGLLNFIFPFEDSNKKCWLSLIKVSNPKYLNRGVGNEMIKMFESYLIKNRCEKVIGKFWPEGEGAKYTKNFYLRHNYEIYNDDYQWFIEKNLRFDRQIEQ